MTIRDYWQETKTNKPFKLIDHCRKNDKGETPKIAMVALTQEEALATTINTERFVRKFFKDSETDLPKDGEASAGYKMIFEQKSALEILFKVCRNPDDMSVAFFKNPDDMATNLTTEEIGFLFKHYGHVRSMLSPTQYDLSKEDVDALIYRIDTEQAVYMLDRVSPAVLGEFILALVDRIKKAEEPKVVLPVQEVKKSKK
jgi:hypothetical protein